MAAQPPGSKTDKAEDERLTLFDLVAAIEMFANDEAEVAAMLWHMGATGQVVYSPRCSPVNLED